MRLKITLVLHRWSGIARKLLLQNMFWLNASNTAMQWHFYINAISYKGLNKKMARKEPKDLIVIFNFIMPFHDEAFLKMNKRKRDL
ncbi:hypothetical protein [Pantoea septica]|uniref:hypothetical protein n=1 Tax=Pantoea septica TaxID=472695 RepID=UPI00289DC066|nr:hypothetical protein [Pantoea septica]